MMWSTNLEWINGNVKRTEQNHRRQQQQQRRSYTKYYILFKMVSLNPQFKIRNLLNTPAPCDSIFLFVSLRFEFVFYSLFRYRIFDLIAGAQWKCIHKPNRMIFWIRDRKCAQSAPCELWASVRLLDFVNEIRHPMRFDQFIGRCKAICFRVLTFWFSISYRRNLYCWHSEWNLNY